MIELFLKPTSTAKAAKDALISLGLNEILARDENEDLIIASNFTHHVAVMFFPNMITKFATFDGNGDELTPTEFGGPHLMIKIMSDVTKRKVREKIVDAGGLPDALELVGLIVDGDVRIPPPVTHVWF